MPYRRDDKKTNEWQLSSCRVKEYSIISHIYRHWCLSSHLETIKLFARSDYPYFIITTTGKIWREKFYTWFQCWIINLFSLSKCPTQCQISFLLSMRCCDCISFFLCKTFSLSMRWGCDIISHLFFGEMRIYEIRIKVLCWI